MAWDSAAARHLVGVAAIAWLISSGVVMSGYGQAVDPNALVAAGAALYLGAGLMLASVGPPPLRSFGATLSDYGAFVFVAIVALALTGLADGGARAMPAAIVGAAAAGVVLACIAAALARHVAPLGAAVAIALGFTVVAGWTGPLGEGDNAADNWLAYALSLIAMLALVTSGTLDDRRPRIVAGWLGLAAVIADITWALHGSLIRRALFLAIAGVVAIALATALGRVAPKEESR